MEIYLIIFRAAGSSFDYGMYGSGSESSFDYYSMYDSDEDFDIDTNFEGIWIN